MKLTPHRLIEEMRNEIGEGNHGETTLKKVARTKRRDPFRVLVATILSQRTRDENTDRASTQLFAKFPSAEALAKAPLRTVERLIRPTGFYHVKARKIKEVAKVIAGRYKGEVPRDLESLLELPLVGRKTANCVLVYGFGEPAIPVDTHVHRISNRLGLVNSRTPEQTERQLSQYFRRGQWIEVNEIMVRFGKKVCRPIGPKCSICPLRNCCRWYTRIDNSKHDERKTDAL
jgi:endonuclease-3